MSGSTISYNKYYSHVASNIATNLYEYYYCFPAFQANLRDDLVAARDETLVLPGTSFGPEVTSDETGEESQFLGMRVSHDSYFSRSFYSAISTTLIAIS